MHYGQGNTEFIRRTLHEFNWQRAFSSLNINGRFSFFNKIILNIVSNFIPHETVICDDRDLPWINTRIKSLINDKKVLYKNYLRNGKSAKVLEEFRLLQRRLIQ